MFNNARPEQSGRYIASVLTPRGEVRKELNINIPGEQQQRIPPSIYSPNPKVTSVKKGDPFTLECVGIGSPLPSIRIETPGRSRMADFNSQMNRQAKVDISYFSNENVGEYICIAENEYGERAIERFRVELAESGEPPYILIEPKTIQAYEGASLSINYTYTVKNLEFKFYIYCLFKHKKYHFFFKGHRTSTNKCSTIFTK